jgi:hypothetical protein
MTELAEMHEDDLSALGAMMDIHMKITTMVHAIRYVTGSNPRALLDLFRKLFPDQANTADYLESVIEFRPPEVNHAVFE